MLSMLPRVQEWLQVQVPGPVPEPEQHLQPVQQPGPVQEQRVLLVRNSPLLVWPGRDIHMMMLMCIHVTTTTVPVVHVLLGTCCALFLEMFQLPAGRAASVSSPMTTSAQVDQAVAMAVTAPMPRAAATALQAAAGECGLANDSSTLVVLIAV
jgi:hypothetical protein